MTSHPNKVGTERKKKKREYAIFLLLQTAFFFSFLNKDNIIHQLLLSMVITLAFVACAKTICHNRFQEASRVAIQKKMLSSTFSRSNCTKTQALQTRRGTWISVRSPENKSAPPRRGAAPCTQGIGVMKAPRGRNLHVYPSDVAEQ